VNEQPATDLLQRLLDLVEIKRLEARYFRAIDRKEWDANPAA
jgi:hypothetical protein